MINDIIHHHGNKMEIQPLILLIKRQKVGDGVRERGLRKKQEKIYCLKRYKKKNKLQGLKEKKSEIKNDKEPEEWCPTTA